jgi:hypothetical protein
LRERYEFYIKINENERKNLLMRVNTKFLFYGIVGFIVILRLMFVAYIPFGRTVRNHLEGLNDEPSHFNYVKYIAENRAFPVETHNWKDSGSLERNDFEYHQAPLFYTAGAVAYIIAGEHVAFVFCRSMSFVCGLLGLLLIALILRKMGFDRDIQAAGVILAGLLPVHVYFTSLASNDSMSWLFSLLTLYLCIVPCNKKPDAGFFTWKRCLSIGALTGIGTLVKASMLLWFPVAAACACYSWYIYKNKTAPIRMFVALCGAMALNIPWFLRNFLLYKSITGLAFTNGPAVSYPHLYTPEGFMIFLRLSVRFFWFPMQHIPPSHAHFLLGVAGAIILGILCALAVRYYRKTGKLSYNDILILGLLAFNIAGYVKYNWIWGNREPRFLYPALLTIVFLMIVPLRKALDDIGKSGWFFPLCAIMGLFGYSYLLLTF